MDFLTDDLAFNEGTNCWRVERADRFGWCIDGEDYFSTLRDALEGARREILIVGWDIDSRLELVRNQSDQRYPSPLCKTLQALVDKHEDLCVRVLAWDFAFVYLMEREMLPAQAFGWKDSERLFFELDSKHATGASHHQKIVIIDGALAFSGGIDLTKCRWDTRGHAPDDPRRTAPGGDAYRPFHDVQGVVTGQAAMALRDLVSARWDNATGTPLPALDETGDSDAIWPDALTVRAKDVDVAIARTWCGVDGKDQVREVEALHLDMIRTATENLYIENQYFTSATIADALAERLAEENGPEVVLVLPGETSGWLEQATMEVLRNQALARLKEADQFNRLRVLWPARDGLDDSTINVHSKIMVTDGRIARIGSANLSQRSMRLDSECDLVINDPDAATALAADLLAEHMDADVADVSDSLAGSGLIATIERFDGGKRWLEPLELGTSEIKAAVLEPVAKIADLEKPLLRGDSDDGPGLHAPLLGWLFVGVIGLVIAFWVYWAVQGSDTEFDLATLLAQVRQWASHPLAPIAVPVVFVLGSLVVAPITGMIAICALVFDPWVATIAAMVGTLAGTAVNHWVGSHFHDAFIQKVPDRITDKVSSLASSSDMWTLAGLRLIPIAPFSVINFVVGASGARLRDLLMGTLIAMTPGIVLISLSVDRARAALAGEPVFDPWIGAAIVAAGIGLIALKVWKQRRKPG